MASVRSRAKSKSKTKSKAKSKTGAKGVTVRSMLAWRAALIAALSETDVSGGKRVTRLRAVADACVAAAIAGNVSAIREIGLRVEDKPGEDVAAEAGPATVRIVHTFKSAL